MPVHGSVWNSCVENNNLQTSKNHFSLSNLYAFSLFLFMQHWLGLPAPCRRRAAEAAGPPHVPVCLGGAYFSGQVVKNQVP